MWKGETKNERRQEKKCKRKKDGRVEAEKYMAKQERRKRETLDCEKQLT